MTYSPELKGTCEAAKIAPFVVPYMQGRSVDIGSGPGKVWPSAIGIDPGSDKGRPWTDIAADGTRLDMFADKSLDCVFSSFLLHLFEPAEVEDILAEWATKLKIGGYLALYLPDRAQVPEGYPSKWLPSAGDIESAIRRTGAGWKIVESEVRSDGDEYALFVVAERTDGTWSEEPWRRNPEGKKRALVIRYGAIGDAIVTASVFPGLKEQGYHVTVNCKPSTREVLAEDPYVDDWLVQETDFVPNEMLGPYWAALASRYDKIINLSESVEGLLLALPGRLNHSYSDATRRALCGKVNYLERTHVIADVPFGFANARFHPTGGERRWAKAVRDRQNGPVVIWVVNGSSAHKVYPWTHVVTKWLLDRTPAHVFLYGDPGAGNALAEGIVSCLREDGADTQRVHNIAGKWKIRQSLAFLEQADCIVGPETGPMNAAAMLDVPKVLYLSHSSAENLTKHWVNTETIAPTSNCFPCHRLHFDWTYCPKDEATGAAACASSVPPESLFGAIGRALIPERAAV